jgi:acyl-coenzyme A thioesterase PaaI-like protein
MRRLDNTGWGFETNCFVCEQSNERGLRIPFFHDEQHGVVVAEFTLDGAFSGAPQYAHGGVVLAIMDEAMAWATIAIAHRFAMTHETTARFERPVRVDTTYRVEANIVAMDGDVLHTAAVVIDGRGRTCTNASAQFVSLGEAQAVRAVGAELGADDLGYLR